MFIDRAEIEVVAGSGGNGVVSWRREKYIPKGGPAGGNGGAGGSIILRVDPNLHGLEWFRHVRKVQAEGGAKGSSSCCKGKDGENTILNIPPGTLVRDTETKQILFDGTTYYEEFVLCSGGRGGLGNAHFRSSTNRAPHIATPGEKGEHKRIELELKLIGDVGFIGYPNAGKSTLLSRLANVDVPIGAYPFTTLHPNLGFLDCPGGQRILLTDIPGIIEGAHQNRGLGLEFLRHIERTRILLYVLDAAGIDNRDPLFDYTVLQAELKAYDPTLLERPSCIVLNKCDLEESKEHIALFRKRVSHPYIIEVSAEKGTNLELLKERIVFLLAQERGS